MSTPAQQPAPEMLARHFKHFATREFPGTSPLYEQLSLAISAVENACIREWGENGASSCQL